MKKRTTKTARICIMLLDDLIRAGTMSEAEAYRMLKKHIFLIKNPFIRNDTVTPPFYKQKTYK